MVVPEVQQVTTHNKAKKSEWEVQEVERKAAKEWVEEANNNNVAQMLQQSSLSIDKTDNRLVERSVPTMTPEDEESWKVLEDCQVSLPLPRLLKLVPWFIEKELPQLLLKMGRKKCR